MSEINVPMGLPELGLKPPISGRVRLIDDMQQSIALLMGYVDNQRKLLKILPSGVLCVASQRVDNVFHITASSGSYAYQGENIPCSEVMVMGHPDNTGRVWVRPDIAALTTNAWPLAKGEVVIFSLSNLNQLYLLIATTAEIAIIAYTR